MTVIEQLQQQIRELRDALIKAEEDLAAERERNRQLVEQIKRLQKGKG